jgi:hypothetical protein
MHASKASKGFSVGFPVPPGKCIGLVSSKLWGGQEISRFSLFQRLSKSDRLHEWVQQYVLEYMEGVIVVVIE